ncbi:MAG: hypothetical protein AAB601_03275, partial [Patescibacteria group bacterium]
MRRIELERLLDAPLITASAAVGNEVLAAGNGTFWAYHTITRTVSTTSIDTSERVRSIAGTADGSFALIVTDSGALYMLNRTDRSLTLIAREVETFALSPEEKRLALALRGGAVELFFLGAMTSDTREQPGARIRFSTMLASSTDTLAWFKGFANQLIALSGGSLTAIEADARAPQHAHTIATNVIQFAVDNTVFVLDRGGDLVAVDLGE